MKRVCACVGLLVLVLSFACTREAGPPPAAVDLVIPPISSAAPGARAGKDRDKEKLCSVALQPGAVSKSSPTCYLDQRVESGGILHYPCGGDGPAEAVFNGIKYTGHLTAGEVDLAARTELDWDGDGCHWGTLGTIRGALVAHGELTKQKLQWTYADRVMTGENCSGTCYASTTFEIHE